MKAKRKVDMEGDGVKMSTERGESMETNGHSFIRMGNAEKNLEGKRLAWTIHKV